MGPPMTNSKLLSSTFPSGKVVAALIVVFGLAACLGGGDESNSPIGTVGTVDDGVEPAAVVLAGYPTPSVIPAAPAAITGFSDAGGGMTTVTTNTAGIANGDAVQISGAVVPSYNAIFNVTNVTATSFNIAIAFAGPSGGVITQIIAGGVVSPGGAANCPTTGGTPFITASVAASRYSGVAPLAVFFDASGTTAATTTRPFHDLEYRWNFGETVAPGTGTWATGSRAGTSSRNHATGPVAAHVFETPGTYTVAITITDGTSTVVNNCVQIAVLDPDVVFAGTKTICLSSAGDFTNCPAGATQVTDGTANFPTTVAANIAAGRRILVRRGETWTASTGFTLSVTGPGIIGAFGPGGDPKPIIQAGNTDVFRLSSSSTPGITDWRIMDLEMDGSLNGTGVCSFGPPVTGNCSRGFRAGGGFNQLTLLRLSIHDVHNGATFSSSVLGAGHSLWDQLAIVDSSFARAVGGGGGYLTYLGAARLAYLGNTANDSTAAEHVLRVIHLSKGVISNNTLSTPATAKHVIKMHAPGAASGLFTEQGVISDNKLIGANNSWTVSLEPESASYDQRLRNLIVERNWFTAGVGTQVALILSGAEFTIRNNIMDMSGGAAHTCNTVTQRGIEPAPTAVRFYNNTCYAGTGDVVATALGTTVTNITVQNNLASAPGTGTMVSGTGASGLAASNNLFNSTPAALFANPRPSAPAHFGLTSKSHAIGFGMIVPVHSDFFGMTRQRGRRFDAGAVKF
jgi:hypothetical protein